MERFPRFRECCLYYDEAGFYITVLMLQNYKTKYCDALQCNRILLYYLCKMNILIIYY